MIDSTDKILRIVEAFEAEFRINPLEPTTSTIAAKTGFSRNSIKKYLKAGQDMGLFQFAIRHPQNDDRARRLATKYELKEAIVVGHLDGSEGASWDNQEAIRSLLCEEVPRYLVKFVNKAKDQNPDMDSLRMGTDGGNTLYQAFQHSGLLAVPRMRYEILPLVVGPLVGSKYTASNVATLLASRLNVNFADVDVSDGFRITSEWRRQSKPDSKQLTLSIQVCGTDLVKNLDILFVAIGSKHAGLVQREVNVLRLPKREKARHHGDICNLGFDERGLEVPMTKDRAILVTLDKLKILSKTKTVVGVAGGRHKCDAIHTALKNGFMSVLITDAETADRLCRLP